MTQRLLVKEPFGDYATGDRITSSSEIKRVTKSHPDYVLREETPTAPKRRKATKEGTAKSRRQPKQAPAPVAGAPFSRNVVVTDPAPAGQPDKE